VKSKTIATELSYCLGAFGGEHGGSILGERQAKGGYIMVKIANMSVR
jgi:hypothetical protein